MLYVFFWFWINKNSNSLDKNVDSLDNSLPYLTNVELESVDILDVPENNDTLHIKSHDEIYLEIYKKAKKKAKEIRKNAVQAFLELKNIKNKYNIEESDNSSDNSSDNEYLTE